jgi:hypothetical protein
LAELVVLADPVFLAGAADAPDVLDDPGGFFVRPVPFFSFPAIVTLSQYV